MDLARLIPPLLLDDNMRRDVLLVILFVGVGLLGLGLVFLFRGRVPSLNMGGGDRTAQTTPDGVPSPAGSGVGLTSSNIPISANANTGGAVPTRAYAPVLLLANPPGAPTLEVPEVRLDTPPAANAPAVVAVPVVPMSTPSQPAGGSDPDKDGLTTDQENARGTNPNVADTDRDGLLDGDEVRTHRTDPKRADTDGDGLLDGEEVTRWKTDPLNPDTDGDKYSDGTEAKGGYNPNGPGTL